MARFTFVRQDAAHRSVTYDDTVVPSEANFETNPTDLESDLNNLRSMLSELRDNQTGNWWNALTAATGFEGGAERGVQTLNQDLHEIERKRILLPRKLLVDVAVGGTDNWVILGAGALPTQTTIAVGAVTTEGTVAAAHGGTFGTHALSEVSGAHALAPKNICEITDNAGDPILSGGRRIWGLLQSENAADGHTATDTTPNRLQISFVRPNPAHTDLEACPAGDIQGLTIRYCYVERDAWDDTTEQDFLARGAAIDIGAGAASVTRQVAYDNQGATPVDLTTNAIIDLEGVNLEWQIRDDDEAILFRAIDGGAGQGTVQIGAAADFDSDAGSNDFLNGASFDTGAAGTTINVGVTANQIDSGGALTVTSAAATDLTLIGAQELFLDDGNQTGSTWAQTGGIKLSETTTEWDDFETAFGGEVSLLNAITQAKNASPNIRKVVAVLTATVAADTDVSGPSNDNNLDADLGDLSLGTFVDDYDIFLNGQLLRNGVDAAANFDVYPGTSLANGQLRFEFTLRSSPGNADVLTVIDRAA